MSRPLPSLDLALLLVSAGSLQAGIAFYALGRGAVAHALWAAGALPVLVALAISIARTLPLLRQEGIRRLIMLTGDRRDVAETIGATLGLTEVRSEQTPSGKLDAIRAARREGTVIMIGDGVNDAPALAAADVGVAMRARGAAASSEAADVVLLVDRLDRLVEGLRQHAGQGGSPWRV
jgi:P-type E1-E2 ATPase